MKYLDRLQQLEWACNLMYSKHITQLQRRMLERMIDRLNIKAAI